MEMTSRERVLAAFRHEEPDRVPSWYGCMPEFWEKAKGELRLDDEGLRIRLGDDFRRVLARYVGPSGNGAYRTVFGIERVGVGYGQPVSHPLKDASLKEIDAYDWPDPDWIDVSAVREEAVAYEGRYAILGGDWSPFWHDAIDLFGMETLLLKMVDAPELVDALMGRIVDYYAAVSRRIFEAAGDAIDIFFIGNDFGSQRGPLVSPAFFRRFLQPHLKRLADLGHSYDLLVQLHCCGGFEPLIDPMIEAGIDGVHTLQPSCRGMDLRHLKETYGSRILLNGGVDSHHVLIKGTPESVRENVREVLDIMRPNGGFVAGASHDTILDETPVANVLAMADAIRKWG